MVVPRRVLSRIPCNVETSASARRRAITPADLLFVRNHAPEPRAGKNWTLHVEGPKGRFVWDLADLKRLRSKQVTMVLECAGNGRAGLQPPVPGIAWGEAAMGCVSFRGVPLARLLKKAGRAASTAEVLFEGADTASGEAPFARSLPIDKALHADTLVAWQMDGRPLTREHGAPLRLVVPGWFGVASVKWLRSVRLLNEPFRGKYQTESYVYRGRSDGQPDGPVGPLPVKAQILEPVNGQELTTPATIRAWGWAWTGARGVRRVDVSLDEGHTWSRARLRRPGGKYGWRKWTWETGPIPEGRHVLMARATDSDGHEQPMTPVWNELGYGNNAVQAVLIHVAEAKPKRRRSPGGRFAARWRRRARSA